MKLLTKKECETFLELAVERTAEYLREYKLKGVTLGISGGIDSAVVAVIGLKALERLKEEGHELDYDYVFLNCDSDPFDKERAEALAKKFGFKLRDLDLTDWYRASPLHDLIPDGHDRTKVAEGNIKCRLRMISLYHSTQLHGHIYLDTDDLSEEYMGFWTKHGDEGDVKIIQHLTKTELYDVGEYLGIPEIILESKPGDGLKVSSGNVAEDQLGLPYMYIEYIMNEMKRTGFDHNGSMSQLEDERFAKVVRGIAKDIDKPVEAVLKVLDQSLRTAYKRMHGDPVIHLLPKRTEFGFVEFGTEEFGERQLRAIKKYG